MAARRCMFSVLLTMIVISTCICFFMALALTGGEESGRRVLPGLRPVNFAGSNVQREILNVNSDAMESPRLRERPVEVDLGVAGVNSFHGNGPHLPQQGVGNPVKDNCTGPWYQYPECEGKMQWMAEHWESEPCYAAHGVNGSKCSFQRYLSEVEHWCPPLSSSKGEHSTGTEKAVLQYDLDPLVKKMSENDKLLWLVRRITNHWPNWMAALHSLESQAAPFTHSRKRVLIYIGALSDKAGFKFAENADHGGPLGELVQWSDLIACLHLLGHSIQFSTEQNQLKPFLLESNAKNMGGCPTSLETDYDVIYIDIIGLKHFKKLVKNRLQHYQCLFRVLDSFGTEPQFNYKLWKPPDRKKGDYGQSWGNWNFHPRQFMTMYPHTPDNSFLGFVVGSNKRNSTVYRKKNIGLVYGKELYMWEGKRAYLDLISRYMDIHATVGTTQRKKEKVDPSVVPGYVVNHGILNSSALHTLLQESKVFIGLGFPYEGPAPLEAIANGCVFLNPKLSPPLDRYNSKFLKGKPTNRQLTSQNPYAENFIGDPYVYTFDMNNKDSIVQIMSKITAMNALPGYLPYEFTYEGMLERLMVYLENQQFCRPNQWPGRDSLIIKISKEDHSCKDTCFREGLVCEPELFSLLNAKDVVTKAFHCSEFSSGHSVHGPSHDVLTNKCSIQTTPLLHSCVGAAPHVQRLCPCRTYKKGQVALCSSCSR